VFVLSACPFRAPEIAETRTVLEGFGLPIAPVAITDRRAFARAVATGRAVTEFESEGKAAEEIRELWHWLKRELTHDTGCLLSPGADSPEMSVHWSGRSVTLHSAICRHLNLTIALVLRPLCYTNCMTQWRLAGVVMLAPF
jgi:hypothetical protein